MAEFLTDSGINHYIEKMIEEAENVLFLVSPYIKLHDRAKAKLKAHMSKGTKLVIIFGKNEDDLSKSVDIEEIEFFLDFPNIEIRFEKRLHAKYYSSEKSTIISSMNLYSYSQDHNIETAIQMENKGGNVVNNKLVKSNGQTITEKAWDYFVEVSEQAELIFDKRTDRKQANGKPIVLKNRIEDFYDIYLDKKYRVSNEKPSTIKEKKIDFYTKPKKKKKRKTGYCIRTGIEIPFDISRPFCADAFKVWVQYKDDFFPEKYCHYSGEESYGDTSFYQPILNKNWKKAKKEYPEQLCF